MDWEASFLLYIQEHIRTDFLNPFMTALTHTGDHGIFLIALAVLLLIIPKTRRIGLIAGISIAIEALLTNVFIKNAVARTRPYEAIDGLVPFRTQRRCICSNGSYTCNSNIRTSRSRKIR